MNKRQRSCFLCIRSIFGLLNGLVWYFVLVTILCAAKLVCGVFGFLYCENIAESLQEELLTGIRLHYNTSPSYNGITLAWDHIQYQLKCCGVRGYDDWFNITAWPDKMYVPHSCCIPSFQHMDDCGQVTEVSMWFSSGCYKQVEQWFKDRLYLISIVGFGVGFIQVFGLIVSMALFCIARRRAGFKMYQAEKTKSLTP